MAQEPILIIDDNPSNVKLAQLLLVKAGFEVRTAGDSEQALETLRSFRPRLILMDIQLPGMNGIEALKVLRADASTAHIPVIAVTASVMQQDRNLITEAGFDGYIGKPINLKEFIDTVRAMLERGSK